MSEISVRKRRFIVEQDNPPELAQMMLVTLDALKSIGGSASLHELDQKVVELEGVTEEEQTLTMPNDSRPRLNYYLAWARTFLRRGKAIENSARGVWSITDHGEGLNSLSEMEEIRNQIAAEEREKSRIKRLATRGTNEPDRVSIPSHSDGDTGEESEEVWKQKLLGTIGEMKADAFERLSQRLLREAGFTKVEVRGKSGDGGIDGVGVLRVNLVSFQVYFQCKKWKSGVGSKEIRDFRGALQGRADKGLFITTGSFTSQASEEATRDGAIAIDLIDGERLCDLLKQYSLGVTTRMIEEVSVSTDWFKSI